MVENNPLKVSVTQINPPDNPKLQVTAAGARLPPNTEQDVAKTLEKTLGINIDLTQFYRFAMRDKQLKPLAQQFIGFKPPRFPTLFEALVNGIACQQVSLNAGISLLNRLTAAHGMSARENGSNHAFPRPEDLSELQPEMLRKLGFSYQKASALIELSKNITHGQLNLEAVENLSDEAALKELCQLRGVGRWTAEYALLRGLGRLHIFPADDVGGRKNLARWLNLTEPLGYEDVKRILAVWKPYGGLIYFHLLLDRLVQADYIAAAVKQVS